jgi:hypothetical protein
MSKNRGSDGICPTQSDKLWVMKLGLLNWIKRPNERVIASFGQARIVKTIDGRMELRSGSMGDRVAAKEWISLFCHEALPIAMPIVPQPTFLPRKVQD